MMQLYSSTSQILPTIESCISSMQERNWEHPRQIRQILHSPARQA